MRLIDGDDLFTKIRQLPNTGASWLVSAEAVFDAILKAPTIEPQRIKGKWIQDNYYNDKYVCDKCGEPCATYINGKPRDMFCKWCGADMR